MQTRGAHGITGASANPMITTALVPELYVSDLARSLHFYLDLIGFVIDYDRLEKRFASIVLGSARIMLEETPSLEAATTDEFARGEWRTAELRRPLAGASISSLGCRTSRGCRRGSRTPAILCYWTRTKDPTG